MESIISLSDDEHAILTYVWAATAVTSVDGDQGLQAEVLFDSNARAARILGHLGSAAVEALTRPGWPRWQLLAAQTSTLSQDRRELIGLEAILANPLWDVVGEDLDVPVATRRIETALEVLGTSFSAYEIAGVLGDYSEELRSASASGTVKVLSSDWLATGVDLVHEGQVFFTGIYVPGLSELVDRGQRRLETSGDAEMAEAYAFNLIRALFAVDHGDSAAARGWAEDLQAKMMELSVARSPGRTGSRELAELAMIASVLPVLGASLGDNDAFILEVAPDLVGMRLNDADVVAQLHGINMETIDFQAAGSQDGRMILRRSGWIVREQDPGPGRPLSRRRSITVSVDK